MATATYRHEGVTIDYTPGSAVAAGTPVVIGNLFGVSTSAIAANALGAVQIEGVFRIPKNTSLAVTAGDLIYWDVADDECNKTAEDNILVGVAVASELAAATTVDVKLTPGELIVNEI